MPIDPPRRPHRAVASVLLLLLSVPVLQACGSSSAEKASGSRRTSLGEPRVSIRLIAFRPEVLRVPAGVRVTWTQNDPGTHTVTSGVVEQQPGGVMARPDGQFDSAELREGETFSLTLDRPGTYRYYCSIHPSTMRGELQIT